MICEVWLLFYFLITYKRKLVILHYIFVEMDTGDFSVTIALLILLTQTIGSFVRTCRVIKEKKSLINIHKQNKGEVK